MSRAPIAGHRTPTDRQLDELIAVSPVKAAELVGLSRATIYNLIERGELRRSKIGKATRIPVADLVALIERGIA
jgi:excisionase family DNA binding protein